VFKKTKKPIKPRKPQKKLKKSNREKKPIKSIKILKKLTGSVRFRFFKSGTEKTEPNQTKPKPKKTEPKPSQTGKIKPNWFEPVFVLKNRTETGRFEPVSVFLKKNSVWLLFFIKTEPNRK